jgi:hypothetical protein
MAEDNGMQHDSEPEDGEIETVGLDDEFRTLESDVLEQKKRFKQVAIQADQNKDERSARVIREVGVNVAQLILDLVQATGGAMSEIDDRLSAIEGEMFEDESRLTDQDAEEMHGLLRAHMKVLGELIEKAPSGDAGREQLEKLATLTKEMLDRVEDMSEWSPSDEAAPSEATPRAEA